ncbi:DUF4383 domain-containing protein [Amycolatopsis sp. VS8301801F10]|uniref:DUF4383 domain-containing protein n=1 Tax=Amycolatopsis sp. VS8301801F10 TaxID=2652442 RepID=UPI0038FCAA92
MNQHEAAAPRRPVQTAALLAAAAFLVVGVLGFIPGVTTHYGELRFAGPHSAAALFGVFGVSVLHNLVHLLFAVAGFAGARTPTAARMFLMLGGLAYLLLWIYGAAIDKHSAANFVPLDHADDWLHLGLGAGLLVLGVAGTAVERARGQYPRRSPAGKLPEDASADDEGQP